MQTIHAAQTLAQYPTSKIAKENYDVFAEAWASQINDLSVLVKDVNELSQGKVERQVYLSLPRPGVSIGFGYSRVKVIVDHFTCMMNVALSVFYK